MLVFWSDWRRLTRTSALIMGSLVVLSGCAVVRVSPQAAGVSLLEQRESVLTRNRLSEASVSVLSMTGQDPDTCLTQLDTCLSRLRDVPQMSSEQYLSTASELYLTQANRQQQLFGHCLADLNAPAPVQTVTLALRKTDTPTDLAQQEEQQAQQQQHCHKREQLALLDSIRYAYAYLMFSNRPAEARLFDNRQVQVRDFYNVAVSRLISHAFSQRPKDLDLTQPLILDQQQLHLHIQSLSLTRFPMPEELVAADDLGFRGLRAINRRDGFGVEFVAILPDILHTETRVHQSRFLPISIVVKVRGDDLAAVLKSNAFDIDVYNPYDDERVSIGHDSTALAANFSAPYGLWLARTDLARTAYRSLLGIERQQAEPQLYMLEPYNPDKRVILLIHGLASSPEAWISLTNDVLGDPILRSHYQVWQVFYPTNMPMLESRYHIAQLVKNAYQRVDPNGHDRANQHSVLIGHSMGAVIGRLLVSTSDLSRTALQQLDADDRKRLLNVPIIKERFVMRPLPSVGRAVFVSAPFQGTDFADRWFTRAIRRVIHLPANLVKGIDTAVQRARLDSGLMDRVGQAGLLEFQNGPSELSRQSVFMQLTHDVQIKKNLPYHLIMGQQNPKTPLMDGSDGIVPYRSSHLAGAVSEKIIQGGHSIQETPEAVLELRRILRLHLEKIGDISVQTPALPPASHPDTPKTVGRYP
jgi:pimeloyl-ACP methyl ester carboxylesterase